MGSQWSRNYFGLTLTEEEFNDIPSPTRELTFHVTDKTFQAGCVLGTVFGTGAALSRKPTRNLAGVLQKVHKYGTVLAIVGFGLGPILTYARVKNLEEDAVRDRCYRLRHNRNQVRVDMGATVGIVFGPLIAYTKGQPIITGAVLGVATGVGTMAIANSMMVKKT